jgi:hypothetical protein
MDTFIFIYVCLISMNLDIYSTPNTMEGNKLTFNVLNTKIEDTKQNMGEEILELKVFIT